MSSLEQTEICQVFEGKYSVEITSQTSLTITPKLQDDLMSLLQETKATLTIKAHVQEREFENPQSHDSKANPFSQRRSGDMIESSTAATT